MVIETRPALRTSSPWLAQYFPNWLNALLDAGIVSDDPQVRLRQRFTNVTAYVLALDAVTHLAVNSFHDFWALLPVNIYNVVAALFYLALHRLHRLGANLAVNLMILGSLLGHSFVVFAFGLDSNLHLYFTFAGFVLFMVGTSHLRNFGVLFGLAVATMIAVMTFASDDGFLMSGDHAFRESLAFQAMLSAMLINAAIIAYLIFTLERAERALREAYDRSELLLHTILPPNIADRLKANPNRRIADHLDGVTVLFADLVGFTPVAANTPPEDVVRYLHRLFSRFDALCKANGVDKIKTIGDSYMAVGGLRDDGGPGVRRIGRLALDMLEAAGKEQLAGKTLTMRIGIHYGPLIAGVIGGQRMTYDVWGDTVNYASRLQSHSEPGRIHVSTIFRDEADRRSEPGAAFDFEPRGLVDIKGFGEYETYFLTGVKEAG